MAFDVDDEANSAGVALELRIVESLSGRESNGRKRMELVRGFHHLVVLH
jgi:hypothetical protein